MKNKFLRIKNDTKQQYIGVGVDRIESVSIDRPRINSCWYVVICMSGQSRLRHSKHGTYEEALDAAEKLLDKIEVLR